MELDRITAAIERILIPLKSGFIDRIYNWYLQQQRQDAFAFHDATSLMQFFRLLPRCFQRVCLVLRNS